MTLYDDSPQDEDPDAWIFSDDEDNQQSPQNAGTKHVFDGSECPLCHEIHIVTSSSADKDMYLEDEELQAEMSRLIEELPPHMRKRASLHIVGSKKSKGKTTPLTHEYLYDHAVGAINTHVPSRISLLVTQHMLDNDFENNSSTLVNDYAVLSNHEKDLLALRITYSCLMYSLKRNAEHFHKTNPDPAPSTLEKFEEAQALQQTVIDTYLSKAQEQVETYEEYARSHNLLYSKVFSASVEIDISNLAPEMSPVEIAYYNSIICVTTQSLFPFISNDNDYLKNLYIPS